MERTEIVCRNCQQVNVRYPGVPGALLNPRRPWTCTVCGADLKTGKRGVMGATHGVLMWSALYLLHGFAGLGALTILVAVVWPAVADRPLFVRMLPLVTGFALGLWLAERSRRNRSILSRAKPR